MTEEAAAEASEGKIEVSLAEDSVTRGFSTVRAYCQGLPEGFEEKPSVRGGNAGFAESAGTFSTPPSFNDDPVTGFGGVVAALVLSDWIWDSGGSGGGGVFTSMSGNERKSGGGEGLLTALRTLSANTCEGSDRGVRSLLKKIRVGAYHPRHLD